MSILHDEGQEAIAAQTRKILAGQADKARLLALLETPGEYDVSFWRTAVEQGWTGLAIPQAHGGMGLGLVELGLVAEATGAATAGAPFLAGNHAACVALLGGCDEDARSRWLPALASGEAMACVAFATGTEMLADEPGVTLREGRLEGIAPGVVAGLHGHFAIVWAQAAGEPALVLADLSQVRRTAIDSFDNSRGFADLAFAGTPATVLAEGDAARALAMEALAQMAVVTAHEQVGGAQALLFTGRDYANTRRAFGQPIGAFQSVKHRLAELYALVEIARANCIDAAAKVGTAAFMQAACSARLTATEAYDTAARDVVQIHGGIGTTWEAGLHLHMRRARSLAIECGNAFFWEDLLACELTGVAA